jgi:accessory gene regulator protein AgrB
MGSKAGAHNGRPGRGCYVLALLIFVVGTGLFGYIWLYSALNIFACIIAGVIFFPLAEQLWHDMSEYDMMWKGYVVLIGSWFIGITMIVLTFKKRRQTKRLRNSGANIH